MKYLNFEGLQYFYSKLSSSLASQYVSQSNLKTINGQSLIGTGDITIEGGAGGDYLPLSGGTLTGSVYMTGFPQLQLIGIGGLLYFKDTENNIMAGIEIMSDHTSVGGHGAYGTIYCRYTDDSSESTLSPGTLSLTTGGESIYVRSSGIEKNGGSPTEVFATDGSVVNMNTYLPLSGGTMTGNITFESAPDSNGHEYVDLGLPSGNLWAKCNIGANTEEEAGLYFQWGDTQGYTTEQVGDGEGLKAFSWADYKFSIDGSSSNFSKYNTSDSKTVLDPEDDAAHVNMGGNWRMPTLDECKELCLNTDIYLVPTEGEEIQGTAQEQNGNVNINWASQAQGTLKGVKFYKKGDKQTYMFVPASGRAYDGSVQKVSKNGNMWSSSRVAGLSSILVTSAWLFSFDAFDGYVGNTGRRSGLPVRGVLSSNTENSKGIIIEGKTESDLLNAAGSTVTVQSILDQVPEPDLSPLQNAIGNNTYEGSNYLTKETNLTDAVIQLDEEIKATNDNLALEHANAEAAYAKKTELGGYLPLTGGEITGAISVPRTAFTHESSGMMVDMQSNADDFQIRTTNAGMKSVTFTIQNTPILKLTEGGIYENGTLLENKYALLTDLPNVVTTSTNGLMSSADKTKLDSINLAGIQVVTALPDAPNENTMYIVIPA